MTVCILIQRNTGAAYHGSAIVPQFYRYIQGLFHPIRI
jgi:hypothetical protein